MPPETDPLDSLKKLTGESVRTTPPPEASSPERVYEKFKRLTSTPTPPVAPPPQPDPLPQSPVTPPPPSQPSQSAVEGLGQAQLPDDDHDPLAGLPNQVT